MCALLPRLSTRTRLVLLLHQLEDRKPTNSGRLALRCLPNSELVPLGAGGPTDTPAAWAPGANAVLLFPHPEARPISSFVDPARPLTLVVPDGTWRQAAKARRRLPGLADVPSVTLPEGAPSSYRLRSDRRAGRLSTMEAIARAMGVLEGRAVEEQLLYVFRVMVERTLFSSGRLAREAVTGGVPDGVHSHDPLSGPPSRTS